MVDLKWNTGSVLEVLKEGIKAGILHCMKS